jgi:CheY-like chemotaxis protein
MGNENSPEKSKFLKEINSALSHLYDPDILRHSPLIQLFNLTNKPDSVGQLRRTLIDGIQTLTPDKDTPSDSNAWRYYKILNYRFVEQFTQDEVALDLGFSPRHLRRQEATAVQVLADNFWVNYNFESQTRAFASSPAAEEITPAADRSQSKKEDLTSLGDKTAFTEIDICETIKKVLTTIGPYLEESNICVDCLLNEMPQVVGKEMAVRQALLHLFLLIVQTIQCRKIEITTSTNTDTHSVCILIQTVCDNSATSSELKLKPEDQELARELAVLAGGTLQLNVENGVNPQFSAAFILPAVEINPVLVVDDNADALRLFQLYLNGTHYRFVGTSDPAKMLPLATELSPAAIILDIMLPGVDGWELLGYLREHPKTQNIPIIVSSILPHERLAAILGAKGFLQKPFERDELLRMLDQVAALASKESHIEI